MINKVFLKYILCILLIYCSALSNAMRQDHLDVFAFNVGQANFNVLRTNNEIVIMDAGIKGSSIGVYSICDLFKEVAVDLPISAVFISHPHKDHYSLVELLYDIFIPQFQNTKFYLGGTLAHWQASPLSAQNFVNTIYNRRCFLSGLAHNLKCNNLELEIFELNNINKLTGNSLSQPIKVTFKGKSILFTGDANAETLEHMGYPILTSKTTSYDNEDEDNNPNISFPYNNLHLDDLKSDIVVLPHHGSASNGSYLFHQLAKRAQCSIICSDPRTMHGLPKMKTLEAIIGALDGNLIRESHYVYYKSTTAPVYLTSESKGYYNIVINQHYCALWNYTTQIDGYTGGNYGRVAINSFDNPTSQLISLSNSKKIYEKVFGIDLETLRYDCKQRIKKGMYVSVEDKNAMKTASLWQKKLQWNSPYLLKNALNITVRLKGNNEFIEAKGTCSYKKEIVKNKYKLVSAFTRKEDDISKAITKQLAKAGKKLYEISTVTVEISKKKNAVKCKHTIIDCK